MREHLAFVLLCAFLAFSFRLLYILLAPPRPIHWDDTSSWDAVASNLVMGKGFKEANGKPTALRPPLYPIFLAGVYIMTNRNFFNVYLFQAILGALLVVLIYLMCNDIFEDKIIPKLVSFLLSIYPPLIVYTQIIGSEVLFTFLLSITIYLLNRYVKYKKFATLLLSALLLGLTNICRSTVIFYPFFFIFATFFIKEMKNLEHIKRVLIFMIVSFLPVLPWTVRNYIAFNRFLLVNTSAGELFWAGTYLPWDGYPKHGRDEHFFKKFQYIKNPVDRERAMFIDGIKNIVSNPTGFLKLTIKKFIRFWFQPVGQVLISEKSKLLGRMLCLAHFSLIVVAIYGFIQTKNKILLLPITVLFIYYTIMHNIIAPIARYRLPIEPYILIFFGYGLCRFFKR